MVYIFEQMKLYVLWYCFVSINGITYFNEDNVVYYEVFLVLTNVDNQRTWKIHLKFTQTILYNYK